MKRLITMLAMLHLLTACTPATGSDNEGPQVQADVARAEPVSSTSQQVTTLVMGNNTFAFDLYHSLREAGHDNLIFSPYSISLAFSLVYAGAQGETAAQMVDVFHYLPPEEQHPTFNTLEQHLVNLDEGEAATGTITLPDEEAEEDRSRENFQLNVANAVWGQEDYPFKEDYLETLARYYGAGIHTADFATDTEAAKEVINAWVAEKTEGKIDKLTPPLRITPNTVLVLANAVYFYGAWLFPFNPEVTAEGAFTTLDGTTVTVPLMQQRGMRMPYREGDGYQVAQIPYRGDAVEMFVILPAEGQFEEIDEELDADFVAMVRGGQQHDVDITMPRFDFDTTLKLADILQNLGLTLPFDPSAADFGGIADTGLFIADALHKGTITVDEEGTEAAAVTAIAMEESAYPTATMTLNRPFLFAIVEQETGTILFLGRVLNPAS